MGTHTFTEAETGLAFPVTVKARWLLDAPYRCNHSTHGGTTCTDPAVCGAHIADEFGELT